MIMICCGRRDGRGEENIAEWKSAECSTGVLIAVSSALGASSRCRCRCHRLRSWYSLRSKYQFVYNYPTEYKHN